jgi:hypothetical protein
MVMGGTERCGFGGGERRGQDEGRSRGKLSHVQPWSEDVERHDSITTQRIVQVNRVETVGRFPQVNDRWPC